MNTQCKHCARKLVIPDFLANQEGTCPFCNGSFSLNPDIPSVTPLTVTASPSPVSKSEPVKPEKIPANPESAPPDNTYALHLEEDDDIVLAPCPNCGELIPRDGSPCFNCHIQSY